MKMNLWDKLEEEVINLKQYGKDSTMKCNPVEGGEV
jgi:hypothetical protein